MEIEINVTENLEHISNLSSPTFQRRYDLETLKLPITACSLKLSIVRRTWKR